MKSFIGLGPDTLFLIIILGLIFYSHVGWWNNKTGKLDKINIILSFIIFLIIFLELIIRPMFEKPNYINQVKEFTRIQNQVKDHTFPSKYNKATQLFYKLLDHPIIKWSFLYI